MRPRSTTAESEGQGLATKLGGGKEALDELVSRQEEEESTLARLRKELVDNKAAVAGLQPH